MEQEDIRVHAGENLADIVDEQRGIHHGADQKRAIAQTGKGIRKKGLGQDITLESVILEVIDHANNLEISIVWGLRYLIKFVEFDLATDGVFIAEVRLHKGAIHHHDAASRSYVRWRKYPAAK
jgi:hypothetical protein